MNFSGLAFGWSANPRQFTGIGHGLAIFANPCPIPIKLDWMIAIGFKNSGVLYIRDKLDGGLGRDTFSKKDLSQHGLIKVT